MSDTMTIVAQCRAISLDIRRRCLRNAVADGLCVQHHRLRAFGIDLEFAPDEGCPIAEPEPVPSPPIASETPTPGKWQELPAPAAEEPAPPPVPPKPRDVLDVGSSQRPDPKAYYRWGRYLVPYQLEDGCPEQMAMLEYIRQIQEDAWYGVGYSREQIMAWMRGWPEKLGYRPYNWTVGPTPLNWKPRGGYLLSRF